MPTASTTRKATATPRKRRTRKTTAKTVTPPINTTPKQVVKVETKTVEVKSLKDYPRDGLSLVLLPVLYLEAFVKEILRSQGVTVK